MLCRHPETEAALERGHPGAIRVHCRRCRCFCTVRLLCMTSLLFKIVSSPCCLPPLPTSPLLHHIAAINPSWIIYPLGLGALHLYCQNCLALEKLNRQKLMYKLLPTEDITATATVKSYLTILYYWKLLIPAAITGACTSAQVCQSSSTHKECRRANCFDGNVLLQQRK